MIIIDAIILILILTILITTCGIKAGIMKIKSEFNSYKYYIFRGAILGWIIGIGRVALFGLSQEGSLLYKLGAMMFYVLIGILPLAFHGGIIGGFIGYIFGKIFGRSNKTVC